MTTQVGYGPLSRVDGPPPIPPVYGLLQAAEAPAAGVRIVPDVDERGVERWINGVQVYPWPAGLAGTYDECAAGSDAHDKTATMGTIPLPQFGAMVIYYAERCTARGVWNQDEFKARATRALTAVEGAALAREFLTGERLYMNPHLSDGNGTFPNGDASTSPLFGVAQLEGEIAKSGKQGLIHMSPRGATMARDKFTIDDRGGVLRTVNGIVVIPDFGYMVANTDARAHPVGHPAPSASQEWMYATGPVDVRRSDIVMLPEDVSEATDRSDNTIVYRAERYYEIHWDTVVQSAVLIDLCKTTC